MMTYMPYIIWGVLILLVLLLWKRIVSLGLGAIVVVGVFLLIGFIFANISAPVKPADIGLGFFAKGYHKTLDDPAKTGDHLVKGTTKAGEQAVEAINNTGKPASSSHDAHGTDSKITGATGLTASVSTTDLQVHDLPLSKVADYVKQHQDLLTKHDQQLLAGANAGLTTKVTGDHIVYRVNNNKINISTNK